MTTTTKLAVCNLCEAICGLELTIEDGTVTGVRGNADDPLSRGHICPKGVAIADIYTDPDRLRRPVRRVTTGSKTEWHEIGWDEAFELVTDRIAETVREHGGSAVGVYLGNPNVHSLGSQTHLPAMLRTLRSRNIYSATSVDQLPHQYVSHLMYGHQLLIPIPDIDRTQYFLVFGGNPMASNGSLMTVPDVAKRLKAVRDRGGKVVVIDPVRTDTAEVATRHPFIRPGTDAAFLLALVNAVLELGPPRIERYAGKLGGLDAALAAIRSFGVEAAAECTGISAAEVRTIAAELRAASSAVVYGRMGVSTQPFGTSANG